MAGCGFVKSYLSSGAPQLLSSFSRGAGLAGRQRVSNTGQKKTNKISPFVNE